MTTLLRALLLLTLTTAPAWGQVKIDKAWARATVQGQKATGAFMQLTAPQATQLVAVSTPVAGVAEIHEMKMDKGVMTMRAVAALDLPAQQTVELQPGGYHLMLMDLKNPLPPNSHIDLTLTFKNAQGVLSKQHMQLPVTTAVSPGAAHTHGPHKH